MAERSDRETGPDSHVIAWERWIGQMLDELMVRSRRKYGEWPRSIPDGANDVADTESYHRRYYAENESMTMLFIFPRQGEPSGNQNCRIHFRGILSEQDHDGIYGRN
jgi:hypothetical protein